MELKRPFFLRPLHAVARTAGCCALLALGACSSEPRISDVVTASAAHFERFARFERWATRMVGSDVRLQGSQALREATFAPLRREPDVLWAEVRASERQLLQYPKPDASAAVAQLRFVNVDAPVGRLSVALSDACRAANAQPVACVIIARPRGEGAAHEVRVAFRRGLSGGARAAK